jgi:hypothetical protein
MSNTPTSSKTAIRKQKLFLKIIDVDMDEHHVENEYLGTTGTQVK